MMVYLKFLFIFSKLPVEDTRLIGMTILAAVLIAWMMITIVAAKHRGEDDG